MGSIGIVGAGVAGLHLGLLLQQHGVPVVIYTDRSAEQVATGRLGNTVSHFGHTLDRERQLGVCFWEPEEVGYPTIYVNVGGDQPLRFAGNFPAHVRAMDYRVYLPRLMDTYEERGGDLRLGRLEDADLPRLAAAHDLLVVAAGKGAFADVFPVNPALTPYSEPQRALCVALVHGLLPNDPRGVEFAISPGAGEVIDIPLTTPVGLVNGLYFSNIAGGPLAWMAGLRYDDDPGLFEKQVLEVLRDHYPAIYHRVDHAEFRVTRPLDVLCGAVTPRVRADYAFVDGRPVLAVGDVHSVVDPVMGQGANASSYSAWVAGQAILDDLGFDELFCQRVAAARADLVHGASRFTNFMLNPQPHLYPLLAAAAQSQTVADELVANFGRPDRQWRLLATPERTARYLEGQGLGAFMGP